ncbi:uncharacterized protein LOC133392146 [Anopheles gambiae]|uniref:uncharacterized protein LOC133392146 n=1 Tax=Anopheles gambiae TaxID=7165 RepID=UPI002AC8DBE1|nr:uncharacterized protein LOC133392146 [Anopheles gambiae]
MVPSASIDDTVRWKVVAQELQRRTICVRAEGELQSATVMSLYPGLKKRQNSILLDRKLQQAEYEAAVGVFDDADVGLQQRRNVIAPDWRLQRATLTSLTRGSSSGRM